MACPRLFKKLFQNDGASRMLRPDIIPASQDITVSSIVLNQFSTAGEYVITGSKAITDGYPEDTTDDIYLKVVATGDTTTQYYLHNGTLLGRHKDATGTWSDWKEVGTNYDSQITDLDERVSANTTNLSAAVTRIDDVTNWESTAQMHNNIYRGANLLDGHFSSIADIMTAVRAGDFSDIYVGDYIPASFSCSIDTSVTSTNFRIAAINLLNARSGAWGSTSPNLCIVPDKLGSAYMNSTSTTAGGYVGSYMYKTVLPAYYTALAGSSGKPFYGYIKTTTERLSNGIDTAKSCGGYSGWTGAVSSVLDYTNQNLVLLNEPEVYGCKHWSSSEWDAETIAVQLPMFRLNPNTIANNGTAWWWLRAVTAGTLFCVVDGYLYAGCSYASYVGTVRPRFFIA